MIGVLMRVARRVRASALLLEFMRNLQNFGQQPRAQAERYHIERRVVVAVRDEAARRAAVLPLVERLLHDRGALCAALRRPAWIDGYCVLPSVFCFGNEAAEEGSPRSVIDGLRKIAMDHPGNLQVLVSDQVKSFEEQTRELAREVEPLVADVLVGARDEALGALTGRGTLPLARERPLASSQCLLALAEE